MVFQGGVKRRDWNKPSDTRDRPMDVFVSPWTDMLLSFERTAPEFREYLRNWKNCNSIKTVNDVVARFIYRDNVMIYNCIKRQKPRQRKMMLMYWACCRNFCEFISLGKLEYRV